MAKINFIDSGSKLLELSMNATADALNDAVKAGAELLKTYTKNTGKQIEGPYKTGQTLASITVKSPKRGKDGWTAYVTYNGVNRKGNRNAEVAFLNEYGARGHVARPFNQQAVAQGEGPVIQKMEDILTERMKG